MDIFKNQIRVDGNTVGGLIKDGKFLMDKVGPNNSIYTPITQRVFTKERLNTFISELEEIKRNM